MSEKDDSFYDYRTFEDTRLEGIMKGWDGLGGYHGLLVTTMAKLFINETALDVGCGLCHLYQVLKTFTYPAVQRYVGVDMDDRVLKMARERYPNLELLNKNVYDLSGMDVFDTTFAIGLYRFAPASQKSVLEMMKHTKYCLNTCYYVDPTERGKVLDVFNIPGWQTEFIVHDIDDKLEIIRLWNMGTINQTQ
jgi:SAM-dependent methyltransferase